jgi:hypothetical protein
MAAAADLDAQVGSPSSVEGFVRGLVGSRTAQRAD